MPLHDAAELLHLTETQRRARRVRARLEAPQVRVHAKRVDALAATGLQEPVQPVDVLHTAAASARALRRASADDRDRRVSPFGATVGGRHEAGIPRWVGRAAPLERQVLLIEQLEIGE